MTKRGIIKDFTRRFDNEEELEDWLKKQNKDYLYILYMRETNYDGVSSRKITKNNLKEIFRQEYILTKCEE